MATFEQVRELLSLHGLVRSQPGADWLGTFALPSMVEQFYQEVGPLNVNIPSYGNDFFLPSLAQLWQHQAGYRWNGLSGEPSVGWDDDWLVVADQGGDPFVLSRSSGVILHDTHGRGTWEPGELFPDIATMAACLGELGALVVSAEDNFTDENSLIRNVWREEAISAVQRRIGSRFGAESTLHRLGWG